MNRFWRNLSLSRKLYALIGMMTLLITIEIITLYFAISTLSAVRAFVMGEGLWSKSQKNAIHSLYQYSITGNEEHYLSFHSNLVIPDGDHNARLALSGTQINIEAARNGFIQGGNHKDDVDGMIRLLVRFDKISFIRDAVQAWGAADDLLIQLKDAAEDIHIGKRGINKKHSSLEDSLNRIAEINNQLTLHETEFSNSLGAGSRWLEKIIMRFTLFTVLIIEFSGLLLTYRFSKNLSQSLKEMMASMRRVGAGDFSQKLVVKSKDDLGQMALSLNEMTERLRITEENRLVAYKNLQVNEERFKLFTNAVKEYAIFMLDINGLVTTWNAGAEHVTGYTSADAMGTHFSFLFTIEELKSNVHNQVLEYAKKTGKHERDVMRRKKDGTFLWTNNIITALYDENNELRGYSLVIRDISDRKLNELRLEKLNSELEERVKGRTNEILQREAQLRFIADALPVLVAQLDKSQNILFANKAFCKWLDKESETIVGTKWDQISGTKDFTEFNSYIERVFSGSTIMFESDSAYEGAKNTFLFTLIPEFESYGVVSGFVLVATNLTKYKEIEIELLEAKKAAESANQMKSSFLANMSHEIRTPVCAILGFVDLIIDPNMPVLERRKTSEIIKRNGKLLINIIDDILDISKIEAGKLLIEKQHVCIANILADIESLFRFSLRKKGIVLSIETNEHVPKLVHTDSFRLRQILLNLVGNSVKFTTKGEISINISLKESVSRKSLVVFEIQDSGKGINPDKAKNLFTPFYQADTSSTREHGGTGLGLVLSRKLAKALGGDVYLQKSELGVGSTFVCTIDPGFDRLSTCTDIPTKDIVQIDRRSKELELEDMKILLVEDSSDLQILFSAYLISAGAKVDIAKNGKEGVHFALSNLYDVILMDLQMPIMDGKEAVKILRQHEIKTPIIALTAHVMMDEKRTCLNSGFDAHLGKPFTRKMLIHAVRQFDGSENNHGELSPISNYAPSTEGRLNNFSEDA